MLWDDFVIVSWALCVTLLFRSVIACVCVAVNAGSVGGLCVIVLLLLVIRQSRQRQREKERAKQVSEAVRPLEHFNDAASGNSGQVRTGVRTHTHARTRRHTSAQPTGSDHKQCLKIMQ